MCRDIIEPWKQHPKILYIDHIYFIENYWKDNLNRVISESVHKNLLLVVDLSTEHWGPGKHRLIDCVYDQLESDDCKFLLLSHRPEDHQRRPNLLFYPSEYHRSKEKFLYPDNWDLVSPRNYSVSCLNHIARPHRIYNWYKAKDQEWMQRCLWSMHDVITDVPRSDEPQLSPEISEIWDNHRAQFAKKIYDLPHFREQYIWQLDHPAYTDSYINIITEHSVIDGIYMSEKTWKPVAAGQLFLSVGNPGSIRYLRSVGVNVFDDVIDHAYYDDEMDWQSRINRMHEILDDLMHQDLDAVYQTTYQQRKINQENFQSGMFDADYSSSIQQRIFSVLGEMRK